MYKWSEKIKQFINEIFIEKNPIKYYENNIYNASDIKFLFFDCPQNTNFAKMNIQANFLRYSIVNLGDYNKTIVLDDRLWKNQKNGIMPVNVGSCVNFDSNIVSELLGLFTNDKITNQGLLSLLMYLKNKQVSVSCSPYLFEDSLNTNGMKNQQKAYNTLLYYFLYQKISEEELHNDLRMIQPNIEDYSLADKAWHEMKYLREKYINIERRAKSIYCFLLKMFIIYFNSKKSSMNKLSELTVFVNEKLGIYYECGMLLAYWKFENEEVTKNFFDKVQPKANDVPKKVETMAWDLFHLWNMPSEMASYVDLYNNIILQSLVTGDVALANLARVNPICRIAIYNKEAQVKYKYSLKDIDGGNEILNLLEEKKANREAFCEKIDFNRLAAELENELLELLDKY